MAVSNARVIPIGAHKDAAQHLQDLAGELQMILQAVNSTTSVEEVQETVARLVGDCEWTIFKISQLLE